MLLVTSIQKSDCSEKKNSKNAEKYITAVSFFMLKTWCFNFFRKLTTTATFLGGCLYIFLNSNFKCVIIKKIILFLFRRQTIMRWKWKMNLTRTACNLLKNRYTDTVGLYFTISLIDVYVYICKRASSFFEITLPAKVGQRPSW